MKKEDFLASDFFKQFKTTEEFNDFFSTLHKRGLEVMLEGELDAHLGYSKHSKSQQTKGKQIAPKTVELYVLKTRKYYAIAFLKILWKTIK